MGKLHWDKDRGMAVEGQFDKIGNSSSKCTDSIPFFSSKTWSNENINNRIEISITHGYEREIHHQTNVCEVYSY